MGQSNVFDVAVWVDQLPKYAIYTQDELNAMEATPLLMAEQLLIAHEHVRRYGLVNPKATEQQKWLIAIAAWNAKEEQAKN